MACSGIGDYTDSRPHDGIEIIFKPVMVSKVDLEIGDGKVGFEHLGNRNRGKLARRAVHLRPASVHVNSPPVYEERAARRALR